MATRFKPVPVVPADEPLADPAILADYQPVQLPRTRADGWDRALLLADDRWTTTPFASPRPRRQPRNTKDVNFV